MLPDEGFRIPAKGPLIPKRQDGSSREGDCRPAASYRQAICPRALVACNRSESEDVRHVAAHETKRKEVEREKMSRSVSVKDFSC